VAVVTGGVVMGCGAFIVKNAIASINAAIQTSIAPKPNAIMSIAPIRNSKPAVANKPVPEWNATCLNERLMKKAAIIAKIQTTTKISSMPVSKGINAEGSRLLVSGVKL
jgi:hypothetical protein